MLSIDPQHITANTMAANSTFAKEAAKTFLTVVETLALDLCTAHADIGTVESRQQVKRKFTPRCTSISVIASGECYCYVISFQDMDEIGLIQHKGGSVVYSPDEYKRQETSCFHIKSKADLNELGRFYHGEY